MSPGVPALPGLGFSSKRTQTVRILGRILVFIFLLDIGKHITSVLMQRTGQRKKVWADLRPLMTLYCLGEEHAGGVSGWLAFPIPGQQEPLEPSGISPSPSRHPQPPPSLPEAGGRARAPRGHHPNSYNQQPRQDFKLTQLSCEGKKTQNENKLTCLHRSRCSNTHRRAHACTCWRMPQQGWETPPPPLLSGPGTHLDQNAGAGLAASLSPNLTGH